MRRLCYLSLSLALLALAARTEVRPFINDRPLALQPDPAIASLPPGELLPQIDAWSNIRINSDQSGQVQNEQQVVVNALNASNVVAVWRDFRLGYRRVGVGYSFDGGWTWHDELFPQIIYPWQSDPALTWHTSGAIYACILSYNPSGEDGIFVSASTNGGVSWGPFVPAVNAVPNSFEDKELIACDRSGSQHDGNLYIAWTKFTSTTKIYCVRSTTGGASWNAPTPVNDDTGVQWPVPAIGPNGQVYIAWVDYTPASIRFDVSTNGGVTWGTDRLVQSTSFSSAYINPSLLIFCYPAMDVDVTNGPNRGYIYIAYSNDVYGDVDLFFTRSTNGGLNWSTPVRINDDQIGNGCDQFHPWLVCDESGNLHVIFYDRRNDPVQNLYMDLYYAHSTDGGLNWSSNERITTVSSNPANDSLDSGLIGEYNGLAVRNGVVHPVWTDTRNLNQDTYTAAWFSSPGLQKHPFAGTQIGGTLDASPTPFNATIEISLALPKPGWAEIAVYDLTGRKIAALAEGDFPAGTLRRSWHPNTSSGIYIVFAQTPSGTSHQKVLYLK